MHICLATSLCQDAWLLEDIEQLSMLVRAVQIPHHNSWIGLEGAAEISSLLEGV